MGKCESCERQKDRGMNANGGEKGGENEITQPGESCKTRTRENRDWCVYTDLGLSCCFYCVSSDASGRPKNARDLIENESLAAGSRQERKRKNEKNVLNDGEKEKKIEREKEIEKEARN